MDGESFRKEGFINVVRGLDPDDEEFHDKAAGMGSRCQVVLQEYTEAALLTWSGKLSGCLVVNKETAVMERPSSFFIKALCQQQWVGFATMDDAERDEWVTAVRHSQIRSQEKTSVVSHKRPTSIASASTVSATSNGRKTTQMDGDTVSAPSACDNGSVDNGSVIHQIVHSQETPNDSTFPSASASKRGVDSEAETSGSDKTPVFSDLRNEVRRLQKCVEDQAEKLTFQAKTIYELNEELAKERKQRNKVTEDNLTLLEQKNVEVAMIDQLAQLVVTPMWQGITDDDYHESKRLIEEIRSVAHGIVLEARNPRHAPAPAKPPEDGTVLSPRPPTPSLHLGASAAFHQNTLPYLRASPCPQVITASALQQQQSSQQQERGRCMNTSSPVRVSTVMSTTTTSQGASTSLNIPITTATPISSITFPPTSFKPTSAGGPLIPAPPINLPSSVRTTPILSSTRPFDSTFPRTSQKWREEGPPFLQTGPRIGAWNRPHRSVSPGGRFFPGSTIDNMEDQKYMRLRTKGCADKL